MMTKVSFWQKTKRRVIEAGLMLAMVPVILILALTPKGRDAIRALGEEQKW